MRPFEVAIVYQSYAGCPRLCACLLREIGERHENARGAGQSFAEEGARESSQLIDADEL
jgi:hypothetical protein